MRRPNIALILVSVAAVLAVGLLALCSGGAYFAYKAVTRSSNIASTRVDELFASIENGDEDIYERFATSTLRTSTTEKQFTAVTDVIRERLGPLQSKDTTSCNVRSINGVRVIDVNYKATFKKGTGTIDARLKNENGEWLFDGFNVRSPVLQSLLNTETCASCGASCPADAKFCPNCGKSVSQ